MTHSHSHNPITVTRSYDYPGYVCSNLSSVRSAALCGDRALILTSNMNISDVLRVLAELGYELHDIRIAAPDLAGDEGDDDDADD